MQQPAVQHMLGSVAMSSSTTDRSLLSAGQALVDLLACMMMQVNQDGSIGRLLDWEHFPDNRVLCSRLLER